MLFKFKLVDVDQVTAITKSLTKKVNKTDLCNSMVWYDSIEYCGYFITKIINQTMETGEFPEAWKIPTVTPISKVKITKCASEHRGINSMPIDVKIVERVVKDQLVDFIEKINKLSTNQSGFRANHSCETTINYIINDWKCTTDITELKLNGKIILFADDTMIIVKAKDRNTAIYKLNQDLKIISEWLNENKLSTKYLVHIYGKWNAIFRKLPIQFLRINGIRRIV